MNKTQIAAFLEKAATDPELGAAFAEFATRHGFEIDAEELSDTDLDAVAGGMKEIFRKLGPDRRTY